MSLELVIIAPLLIALLMFVLAAGRYVHAGQQVSQAAEDAARGASEASSDKDAKDAIDQAITSAQADDGDGLADGCRKTLALVLRGKDGKPGSHWSTASAGEGQTYEPGGSNALGTTDVGTVRVTLTCSITYKDLNIPLTGGSLPITRTFISPLDQYRGYNP